MKTEIETVIRSAGFEDAGVIYALIKEHPREVVPRAISDIVQNIDRFLVCEARGRIIGTAAWQILPEIGKALNPFIEIKSVSIREPGKIRGVRLFNLQSILDFISTFETKPVTTGGE